ncbi:hypothetical protein IW140_005214 [Coemansia sp. RSA 1813]|nr:hypothetical protein IW140_005214 [Coemansia sp. RSA 1813]
MPSATPLKPITGLLKGRVIRDITVGLGAGTVGATIYWHYFKKHMQRTEDYYAKIGHYLDPVVMPCRYNMPVFV